MVAEILTKLVEDLLALANVIVYLGITRHFRRVSMRSLLSLTLFDAAQARLTALDPSELTNKFLTISSAVSAFRRTML